MNKLTKTQLDVALKERFTIPDFTADLRATDERCYADHFLLQQLYERHKDSGAQGQNMLDISLKRESSAEVLFDQILRERFADKGRTLTHILMRNDQHDTLRRSHLWCQHTVNDDMINGKRPNRVVDLEIVFKY